jgi:pimeloyl-ACP methyl ester carboxylesterase
MGVTNSLRVAIDHPERLLGLVLVDGFAAYRLNDSLVAFFDESIAPLTDPVDPVFVREFQQSTTARPVPPEFLDLVVNESLKVPAHVWHGAFRGFFEDDVAGEIGRVTTPTLIVWGDRDRYAPRSEQEVLRAAIQGSRLLIYEGTGHAPHWEEPERFAADLDAFVREVSRAAASAGGGA